MLRIERVGQVFTNPIKLDLLPFEKVPPSYYQVNISYITGQTTAMVYSSSSFHTMSNVEVILGNDVRQITITILDLHRSHWHRHYTIRADHLILLNLAQKLLKPL